MGYLFCNANYLFITYIVTSKPKRMSVAAGVVHMINILLGLAFHNDSLHVYYYERKLCIDPMYIT